MGSYLGYFLHIFLIYSVFKYESIIIKWIWKSIVSSPTLHLSLTLTYSLSLPRCRLFSFTLHLPLRTSRNSQPRKNSALKPIAIPLPLWKKSLSSSSVATHGVLNRLRGNSQQGVKIQQLPVWVPAWWSTEASRSTLRSKSTTFIAFILQPGSGKSYLPWRRPIPIPIHWHLLSMMKICWWLGRNCGCFLQREWIGSYKKETCREEYGRKFRPLNFLFNCGVAQR